MQAARILFAVASQLKTGTITLRLAKAASVHTHLTPPSAGDTAEIEVDGGFVYSLRGGAGGHRGRPEERLRLILAREADSTQFDEGAPPRRLGRCAPFHPAALIRNHVEARLDGEVVQAFRRRAGAEALRLLFQPHPSCLGRDERPLVALLATPRTLQELEQTRLAPPARVQRLCVFLEAVGSLDVPTDAHALLGVAVGSTREEIRSAYRRLARELHPDLHANAPASRQRELAARFVSVSEAYRRLLPGD